MTDYPGRGGGATGPTFAVSGIRLDLSDQQRNQPENGAYDSGDIMVVTLSNDHSDEATTVVPEGGLLGKGQSLGGGQQTDTIGRVCTADW